MALGGFPIPPWLNVQPSQFAQASEAGLREGLAAAQIWASANEQSRRLEAAAAQKDKENQLEQERLQQQMILGQQKLAVDREYNKAAIAQAQAKLQQTQASAAEKAQQWAATHALNVTREADTEADRATKAEQAALNQQNLDAYRQERLKQLGGVNRPFRLPAEEVPRDQLMAQKISKNLSTISELKKQKANATSKDLIESIQKNIDDLEKRNDEILESRTALRRKKVGMGNLKRLDGTTAGGLKYSAVQTGGGDEDEEENGGDQNEE